MLIASDDPLDQFIIRQPEYFLEQSKVDLYVKSVALAGMLELVPRLKRVKRRSLLTEKEETLGIGTVVVDPEWAETPKEVADNFFFENTNLAFAKVKTCMKQVERLYSMAGGVKKAFAPGSLRKIFQRVDGVLTKTFKKSDLELLAAPFRDVAKNLLKSENKSDEGRSNDLAVVDFGIMLTEMCQKRYAGSTKPLVNLLILLLKKVVEDDVASEIDTDEMRLDTLLSGNVTDEEAGDGPGGGDTASDPSGVTVTPKKKLPPIGSLQRPGSPLPTIPVLKKTVKSVDDHEARIAELEEQVRALMATVQKLKGHKRK